MAMNGILVDTNAYTAFKQGQPDAVEIFNTSHLGITSTILGELLAGFAVGSREERNRTELQQFLSSNRVHPIFIDTVTAEHYATVYRTLRNKGRPIPTNDMWIAASALQHRYVLFSYDAHFQYIDGLLVGSRLVDILPL